jgi:hypothetical protein
MTIRQFLLLLATVIILLVGRMRDLDSFRHLRRLESLHWLKVPIFSSETIQGREAEFINDRLPKRPPLWLVTMLGMIVLVVAWRLSR